MLRSPQGQNKRWLVLVNSSWAHHINKKAPIGLLIGAFLLTRKRCGLLFDVSPAHKRTAFERGAKAPTPEGSKQPMVCFD
jgi:hypothetical protein